MAVADRVAVLIIAVSVVTAVGCGPHSRSSDRGVRTISAIWIARGVTGSIAGTARDAVAWAAGDRMSRAGSSGVTSAGVAVSCLFRVVVLVSFVFFSTTTLVS